MVILQKTFNVSQVEKVVDLAEMDWILRENASKPDSGVNKASTKLLYRLWKGP